MVCLFSVILAIGTFCAGLFMGSIQEESPIEELKEETLKGRELTEEEALEVKKRQREMQNFFNYNGDTMPEVSELDET